ncbi:MAG: BLUF domain-containing protein, partial [Cyclobacteriaceae bacterium]
MLSNLVYISNRKPNCSQKEIDQILEASARNNKELDITGVLLYSEAKFVQYLEGEYNVIMDLYDKIKKDDRHNNAVLISNSVVKERAFPSWQMGEKIIDLKSIEYGSAISPEDKKEFQKILSGEESN